MRDDERSVVTFTALSHMMVHTYELSIPILMTVWLLEFSVTAATLGAVVTVGYFLFGAGALPGGVLVDRFGSRPVILACLVGMALSFILLGVAPNVYAVTLALGLWGLAASLYHPAGLTMISKGVREPGWALAYHGMAGNVGIALGPLATALLLLAVDWRIAAALLVVPTVAIALLGVVLRFDETAAVEEDRTSKGEFSPGSIVSETRALASIGFLTIVAIVMFNGLYYRGVLTFLPDMLGEFPAIREMDPFADAGPIAEEFDPAQYVFVGLLTIGILGQYLGGVLLDRLSAERGLVVALAALAVLGVGYVPVATAGFVPLLGVSALLGVVLFAMQPLTQATIAAYSPPEARGLSFGWTFLAIFGIGAFGASIAGVTLTYGSETALFFLLATFALVGCLLALSLVVRDRGAPR